MARRLPRALALAALALSPLADAYSNYSSMDIDMMRAQLALMADRPKDCPPW
jgi:hypothetical protein